MPSAHTSMLDPYCGTSKPFCEIVEFLTS